ncbi:integral membrane sensor signal transduction histidine kinase [Ferroglobus placidus DSM 10642]|uniref:histidine kinase n=1 Tax=Ferroglobus placidus (strain DSM 10642 / AEDII12DO) TaxID=589924 RepID=D3S204_FERPA|nr:CHASE4 domain-containing protein [Ferroglobus placidus]ADC64461.1 integral membrane sensor signal transduction histidine kinase [Ferroglobus placidus DSM 10642]
MRSNWVNETYPTLGINYAIYFDKRGNVVFAGGYNLLEDEPMKVPPSIIAEFRYLLAKSDEDVKKGFLRINDEILIFSSRPILHSNETGPFVGTLIFARVLDEEIINAVREISGINVSISLTAKNNTETTQKFVMATYPLKDYRGEQIASIVVLKDRIARNILYQFYLPFALSAGVVGGIVILSYLVFVKKYVVKRLENVTSTLQDITLKEDFERRVSDTGDDEIAVLSRNINVLLDKISKNLKEIKSLNDDLRLINRIMRHDILNSLTAIQFYADLLEEEYKKDYVGKIKESTEKIVDLIKRIRVFELSLEKGIKMKPVDLEEIILELSKEYGVEAVVKGDLKVLADDSIKNVFDNLISNSVKHGRAKRIFVEGKREGDFAIITFYDDGIGIREDIADKIFEEGVTTGGSGLGLYIAKRILEKYGGEITLADRKQAKFLIKLKAS